jgi:glycogen debranching enzyme
MWDKRTGYFWALHQGTQPASRVDVRTPFNLLPLITGRMPGEIASRLIDHLTQEFWPRYPIPTVALDDPSYNPNLMWRGPTWINVNYLFIEDCSAGQAELARAYATHPRANMRHGDIYNTITRRARPPPAAAPTFNWSAALFIDLACGSRRSEAGQPRQDEVVLLHYSAPVVGVWKACSHHAALWPMPGTRSVVAGAAQRWIAH